MGDIADQDEAEFWGSEASVEYFAEHMAEFAELAAKREAPHPHENTN